MTDQQRLVDHPARRVVAPLPGERPGQVEQFGGQRPPVPGPVPDRDRRRETGHRLLRPAELDEAGRERAVRQGEQRLRQPVRGAQVAGPEQFGERGGRGADLGQQPAEHQSGPGLGGAVALLQGRAQQGVGGVPERPGGTAGVHRQADAQEEFGEAVE